MIATAESKKMKSTCRVVPDYAGNICPTYSIIQLEVCTFEETKAFVMNALAGRLFQILRIS